MSEASKTPGFTLRLPSINILYLICAEHMKGPAITGCVVCALTEALDRAQRVEQDIQAYRGALGYTVPAKYDGRLSDGTVPRCGICEAQSSKIAALEKALERSRLAIDDWINTYASEMCDEARVKEAYERIGDAGGTLAYIADVQQQNRKALASSGQGATEPSS